MAWFIRIFKAIESFGVSAYKNPMWYFWTICAGGLVSVLVPYHLSYLDEQAKLEQSILEQETLVVESGRICGLHEEVKAKSLASTQLFQKLQSITKGITDTQQMEMHEQEIQQLCSLTTDDKERLEFLLAKVKGTQLRVNLFDEDIQTYQALLATDISMMEVMESFCHTYLSRNVEYITQQVTQIATQFRKLRGDLINVTTRLDSQGFRQQSNVKSILIERNKLVLQGRAQTFKKFALLPAIAVTIIYLLTLFIGVSKAWKKSRPQVLRNKRLASRLKKGRK